MNDESYKYIRQARSLISVLMHSLPSAEPYVQLPSDELMEVLQQLIEKIDLAVEHGLDDETLEALQAMENESSFS